MRNRKAILVIDVEATCWNTPAEAANVSEIIEIGVTPIDFPPENRPGGYRIGTPQGILVRPEYSTVSPFCTALTGWTQADVEKGVPFPQAIRHLRDMFDTKNCIFASWGKYDDKMFYRMCELHGIGYPFNNDHLNVKALWGAKYGGVCGVEDALESLGMKFVGRPHRGSDDTYNIARLLVNMLPGPAMC